jgi:hypothetical protein
VLYERVNDRLRRTGLFQPRAGGMAKAVKAEFHPPPPVTTRLGRFRLLAAFRDKVVRGITRGGLGGISARLFWGRSDR